MHGFPLSLRHFDDMMALLAWDGSRAGHCQHGKPSDLSYYGPSPEVEPTKSPGATRIRCLSTGFAIDLNKYKKAATGSRNPKQSWPGRLTLRHSHYFKSIQPIFPGHLP